MSEPTHFASNVGDGPWQVPLWGTGDERNWYIYNTKTRRWKKIGPVRLKGKNYFDAAVAEAQRRNAEVFEKQQAALQELLKMDW